MLQSQAAPSADAAITESAAETNGHAAQPPRKKTKVAS
jgi:hypothetical protein